MVNKYRVVYQIVAAIPFGRVTTYGSIARVVPVPRGARGVGWALATNRDAGLPWWRVVAANGFITSPDAALQCALLRDEGVLMHAEHQVDLATCFWIPTDMVL
ncbi:MAG: cysteine methyltransferase [Chloroflexia bacterium]|nr:cysteine methyltransferase [Chloroflexia bacterium]